MQPKTNNPPKNHLEILDEIVSKFKNDRESIAAGWAVGDNNENEEKRKQFVNQYPLEKIKKLSLEEYVFKSGLSGEQSRNNFCSQLDDLYSFGALIRYPLKKFGMYMTKSPSTYKFKKTMGGGQMANEKEAFEKSKNVILEILIHAEKQNWEKLNEKGILPQGFKSKILAIYFPENSLMIHAIDQLRPIAINFGLFDENESKKKSLFEIQQALLTFKNSQENLKNLNNLEYSHVLWYYRHGYKKGLNPPPPEQNMDTIKEIMGLLKWKKNVILYGPPGTGKTYHCNIIIEEFTKKNKDKLAICWPTDKDENKIEDFARVIKENGKVLWGVNWNLAQVKSSHFPLTGYIYYKGNIIGISKISDFTSHAATLDEDLKLRAKPWNDGSGSTHYIHMKHIERCDPFPHKKLKLMDPTKEMPKIVQQQVYVNDLNPEFIKSVTFHPSYSYEDFVEGIRPVTVNGNIRYELKDGIFKEICNLATNDPDNNYLLIIDEINRGNIPKIFGELITLIEDNKRNKLSVNLAYSQNKFTVPPKLFIIGTMNTADKSLIEVDAALRRRFAFYELMPDPDLPELDVEVGKVNLGKLLRALNKRIREEDLRDKQIGHSYFMPKNGTPLTPENLQRIFKYEVIPLLYDYFYGEFDTLEKVLGGKIVSKKNMEVNYKKIDDWAVFEGELVNIIKEKQQSEEDIEAQSQVSEITED